MRWCSVLFGFLAVSGWVEAKRSLQHVGKKDVLHGQSLPKIPSPNLTPRKEGSSNKFANEKTGPFLVDGTKLPLVPFDAGDSFAGLLSITKDPNAEEKLFFWFWPSTNREAEKEIVLWLNGGPGCSSLMGMIQENGPFLWQPGAYQPEPNPWSWHHLSNVVYVEQPRGTGYSPLKGNATIRSEEDLAKEFAGFWKNFIELFDMQGYKIYITGESYAGMYAPFIGAAMLDLKDTSLYNVSGLLIYDPLIGDGVIQDSVMTYPYVNSHKDLFPYNNTFSTYLKTTHDKCGFGTYIDKYLKFPAVGQQPTTNYSRECIRVWVEAYLAILEINPCFDIYRVSTTCPMVWDPLGFASEFGYTPLGSQSYLNRTDVKKVIHVPEHTDWSECSGPVFFNDTDTSDPSSIAALPRVIDATRNVIIGHGLLDMILIPDGTLLTIQNMTWGGKLGFERPPDEKLVVPQNWVVAPDDGSFAALAGRGIMGTAHEERGLTYTTIELAGHMVPEFSPSVAFRHLEKLLGRVKSLNEDIPFTINVTNPTVHPIKQGGVGSRSQGGSGRWMQFEDRVRNGGW